AFFGDRFLCDLDQYLLAFLQQISDRGLLLPIPASGASLPAARIAASAAASVARITTAARVAGFTRRRGHRSRRFGNLFCRFGHFLDSCDLFLNNVNLDPIALVALFRLFFSDCISRDGIRISRSAGLAGSTAAAATA